MAEASYPHRGTSNSSDEHEVGALEFSLEKELHQLNAHLDSEFQGPFHEEVTPINETHQYQHSPEGYSPNPVPEPTASSVCSGSQEELGGNEDVGMPIYATIDKIHKTKTRANVPHIVINDVHDDDIIEQQSEESGPRSTKSVTFTSDTIDNEGTSRRYRKEKLGDSNHGKTSPREGIFKQVVATGPDDLTGQVVIVNQEPRSYPGSPVHTIVNGTQPSGPGPIPPNRGYEGSVISYQYVSGTPNQASSAHTQTLNIGSQPTAPVQYVPHSVERVGLPPLSSVNWSPPPRQDQFSSQPWQKSTQDYSIRQTQENVSVISISSAPSAISSLPGSGSAAHIESTPTPPVSWKQKQV